MYFLLLLAQVRCIVGFLTIQQGRNILMFNMRATLIAIKCGSLMVHVAGVSNMNPKQKNEEKEPQNDINKSLEL